MEAIFFRREEIQHNEYSRGRGFVKSDKPVSGEMIIAPPLPPI